MDYTRPSPKKVIEKCMSLPLRTTQAEGPRIEPDEARMTRGTDVYFSADVETDGPIPGPFSILSFALVYAGRFDGHRFSAPNTYDQSFYREMKPISSNFQPEALRVNGLDRDRLLVEGQPPDQAMTEAAEWIAGIVKGGKPILVAYPLSFDWSWLYWYFTSFSNQVPRLITPCVLTSKLPSQLRLNYQYPSQANRSCCLLFDH